MIIHLPQKLLRISISHIINNIKFFQDVIEIVWRQPEIESVGVFHTEYSPEAFWPFHPYRRIHEGGKQYVGAPV